MKKTILWSLISAGITLLWISVGKFAYAEDIHPVTTKPMAPAATVTHPTMQPVTMPAIKPVSETFTPAQIKQLHEIIRDYLVKNPEVLVEASRTLQAQQEKQMQSAAMGAITQNKNELFNNAESPSIGNKEASVTLVEFFDYQCGHCVAMAPHLEKLVTEDKNIHIIFKELPIFGAVSEYAAKAALAAAKQSDDKYYTYHNLLFTAGTPLTKEKVIGLAKKAGLNVVTLKKDMVSPEIDKQIKANFRLAQALKIMGTPTFVLSNKAQNKFAYIPGAVSLKELQAQIKSVQ